MTIWNMLLVSSLAGVIEVGAIWWRRKRLKEEQYLSSNGRCPKCQSILRDHGIQSGWGAMQHRGGSNYTQEMAWSVTVFCPRCGFKETRSA